MKTKVVIFRKDRNNDARVLRNKHIIKNSFRHKNHTYFFHPDRFQITYARRWWNLWWKTNYTTFYYREGMANPFPIHDLPESLQDKKKPVEFVIVDNGVDSEEIAAIFNPFFYRIISQVQKEWWKELTFWFAAGAALGTGYLIYQMGKVLQILQANGGTP